jgi:hypothetical protein
MRDAKLELSRAGVAFNIEETAGVITGIDAVEEFTFTNQNKMDMHPFYLFRFECEANYDFNTPCDYQTNQFVLTMSSDDETQGLTLPEVGAHIYKDGANVTVYPVPKTGYEWLKWQLNGVDSSTENPIITMDSNKTARAFFQATLTAFFRIFNDLPELVGDEWQYTDEIGGSYAKINTQVAAFDDLYITHGNIGGTKYPCFKIKFKPTALTGFSWLGAKRNQLSGSTNLEWQLIINQTSNTLSFLINDGDLNQHSVSSVMAIQINTIYDVECYYDGADMVLIINGNTYTLNIGDITYSDRGVDFNAGKWLTNYFEGIVYDYEYCDYITGEIFTNPPLQEGQGANIYDSGDNANSGTVIGAVLADFWGTKTKDASPVLLLDYDYTLFQNDTDGTYLPVVYSNGVPQETSIVGFTKIAEVPKGFGFTNGNHTLSFEQTAQLITFGINNGIDLTQDQSFDDIINYTTSAAILREGSSNVITKLEFKE